MSRSSAQEKRSRSSNVISHDRAVPRGYGLPLSISIVLALTTFLVYCRCFDFGFIHLDDPAYVFHNDHTLDLLPSNSPLRQGLLIRQGSLAHWGALEQKLPDA